MPTSDRLQSVVGAPVLRAEGPDTVAGRTLYAADIDIPGLLWGKVLRSPHAHARIRVNVADAVGARLFDLPVTAEKIYNALKKRS